MISLSGVYPLAVTSDGDTLIVGTRGDWGNGGPIRFLDLATGKDTQAPLALKERKKWEEWQFGFGHSATTISDAKLSDDGQRLVVVETELGEANMSPGNYFITVFDLATRAVILEKDIPWAYETFDNPVVQLSHDGRLLACTSTHWAAQDMQRSIIVWDLNERKEHIRLPERSRSASFQFSPDGKLLAWFGRSGFQLSDTATGALVRPIPFGKDSICVPAFSPDGRLVAVDDWWGGEIRVFDAATGNQCAQVKGVYPQFLPGGTLIGVRGSSEIVAWSSDGWSERRTFPCDLAETIGESIPGRMRTVMWPTGRPNEFAVNYITRSGSWKRWGQMRIGAAGPYVPSGVCLDVIDAATGSTSSYDLGAYKGYGRWFPFPQAGKVLIPQSDDAVAVWSIPPRRSYRAVWLMAGFLPVIAVLGYALIFVIRRAVRRYRGRPQTGATL